MGGGKKEENTNKGGKSLLYTTNFVRGSRELRGEKKKKNVEKEGKGINFLIGPEKNRPLWRRKKSAF